MTANTSKDVPTTATSLPADQQPDLVGWPKWMREALAYVPDPAPSQRDRRDDNPAMADPAKIRILSSVSPRRSF